MSFEEDCRSVGLVPADFEGMSWRYDWLFEQHGNVDRIYVKLPEIEYSESFDEYIIKEFLKQAIGAWEQRITFQNITVTRVDAKIHIEVTYIVNGTNSSQYLDITYDRSDNSLNTQ